MFEIFRQQPRPFYMIFMLEIWERFGFYTVQGILILYFIHVLGFDEISAYHTFGAFIALMYGIVPLGGYLGDKCLGTKRTLVLGLFILTSGYIALALSNSANVFFALGLICVGNGIFKSNPTSLLSKCYAQDDPQLHGGFTLYYMSINLGAIFALIIGPWAAHKYGYRYAYLISAGGLLLGLLNYGLRRKDLAEICLPADARRICWWLWALIISGLIALTIAAAFLLQAIAITQSLVALITCVMVIFYFYSMHKEDIKTRRKMLLAFLMMVEAVIFFSLYHQMPASLTLFAVKHVQTHFLGMNINPVSLQVLNPIWIMTLSPVLAGIYLRLNQAQINIPIPFKFALGMFACGLSFLVLAAGRFMHTEQAQVSIWLLIVSYGLQGLGELFVSALGTAMIAELVPQRMIGWVIGMWFLTSSVAGFTGAKISAYTAVTVPLGSALDSLMLYTRVFGYIGWSTVACAVILGLLAPRLSRLMR